MLYTLGMNGVANTGVSGTNRRRLYTHSSHLPTDLNILSLREFYLYQCLNLALQAAIVVLLYKLENRPNVVFVQRNTQWENELRKGKWK